MMRKAATVSKKRVRRICQTCAYRKPSGKCIGFSTKSFYTRPDFFVRIGKKNKGASWRNED